MIIVVVIMSIAIAYWVVQTGISKGWPIPPVLLRPIILPNFIYSMPGLASLVRNIVSVNYLQAYIVISLVLILILGGILSIVYAILYGFTAPSRYGPLDSPPIKRKIKQFKR